MDRRCFCAWTLAALLAAPGVGAHPDHRDGDLHIDIVVEHTGDRVDVIVRTPLELFEGVGLPLTGRNYVDVAAFREPDPIVGDGRTYEERAVAAVRGAFRLVQEGSPVPLQAVAAHLAPDDGLSPEAHVAGAASGGAAMGEGGRLIDAHHGFLDIHFTGELGYGPVDFVPALAAGAGSMVTFRLIVGDGSAPVTVANEGAPVRLAP
jgi:hypothetical protein